ncbi:MAG: hypothetical protein FWG55_07065 [Candidatus Bathyarchaeota archaeon]|nr:hypothetical protein [Candidatus Termiticorpusculum sp.]
MKKSVPLVARLLFTLVIIITAISIVVNFYTNSDIPHWVIIGVVLLEVLMVCMGVFLTVRHNRA